MAFSVTYTFSPNTLIRSAYVNQNFTDVVNEGNTFEALYAAHIALLDHGSTITTAISYSVAAGVSSVLVSDTSAARTITIPTARLAANARLEISDISGACGVFAITIAPQAELINGLASIQIVEPFGSVILRCDATGWWVVADTLS